MFLFYSKEEIERCKRRDMLEQLLAEMAGEYPALGEVFVDERDVYLTHSLQMAASSRLHPRSMYFHFLIQFGIL